MGRRKNAIATVDEPPPAAPDIVSGIANLGAQALALVNTWAMHPLTVEGANSIGEKLRAWGQNLKMIAAERDLDVKPIRAEAQRRASRWANATRPWEQAIAAGKAIIDAWRVAEQERALAALPAAVTVEERERAVEVLTAKPMATRKYYSAKVVDPMSVRAAWWAIDQKALDAHASAVKEDFDEPGCVLVIEEKSTLA